MVTKMPAYIFLFKTDKRKAETKYWSCNADHKSFKGLPLAMYLTVKDQQPMLDVVVDKIRHTQNIWQFRSLLTVE